jgi:hypothetical protein
MEAKLHRLKTRSLSLLIALFVTLPIGCGPPKEKLYRVYGEVTFKGAPVPKGNVFFDPDVSKGGSGKQGFAGIIDGKYDTALPDGDGIRKGAYAIRVQSFDGKPKPDYPFGDALTIEYIVKQSFQENDNRFDINIKK